MQRPDSAFESFTLAPLSAGDIIDRAVRIYRQQFWRLLQIVIWPSLIAYTGVIIYTFGMRNFTLNRGDGRIILGVAMVAGGFGIYALGKIAFYVILGGTALSLVNYFFNGDPVRPREVYRAVRDRFWSLVGAILLVAVILMVTIFFMYMLVITCLMVYLLGVVWLISSLPNWFQITSHVVFGSLLTLGLFLLGLLVFKRVVFIPQALMVEGRGVFSAVGRSFSLAGSDVRQIGAIVLFDAWLTFSLLYLFILPLGWYAWVRGISLFGTDAPLWYSIAYQTLSQVSEILLAPIAMLGFTLLYLDSRIRQEGFDIEVLASRRLAPPPVVSAAQPVQNAVSAPVYAVAGQDGYITERPASIGSRSSVTAESLAEAGITSLFGDSGAGLIRDDQPAGRICQNCGGSLSMIDDSDRFCPMCGVSFGQSEP